MPTTLKFYKNPLFKIIILIIILTILNNDILNMTGDIQSNVTWLHMGNTVSSCFSLFLLITSLAFFSAFIYPCKHDLHQAVCLQSLQGFSPIAGLRRSKILQITCCRVILHHFCTARPPPAPCPCWQNGFKGFCHLQLFGLSDPLLSHSYQQEILFLLLPNLSCL